MFLTHRPSSKDLERFIQQSKDMPLSYERVGIAGESPIGFHVDESVVCIGNGQAGFERARKALINWAHFELGWVELFPRNPGIEPGSVVAVLVRHLGFWSLNACRVLYVLGDRLRGAQFGFAYGTLVNHAEKGEEIFEVTISPDTDDVFYRIRAVSKPRAVLARVGYPITRELQLRFRRDSVLAMRRAVGKNVAE
jgi:uncharacterized protein (UPF0548 family)